MAGGGCDVLFHHYQLSNKHYYQQSHQQHQQQHSSTAGVNLPKGLSLPHCLSSYICADKYTGYLFNRLFLCPIITTIFTIQRTGHVTPNVTPSDM